MKIRRSRYIIAIIAIIILGVILYSVLNTSNMPDSEEKEEIRELGVPFNAQLDIPTITLKGEISEIQIYGYGVLIDVNGQEFDREDTRIRLIDFNGEIGFNEEQITELNGKAQTVFIGGSSISPEEDTIDIEIKQEFDHSLLYIEEVYVNELDYISSGKIVLDGGKQTILLDEEKITVRDFYGTIDMYGKIALLTGDILELDVEGERIISIS